MGLFLLDNQGLCLYSNSRCNEITGLSAAESLGTGWLRSVHPQDVSALSQAWRAAADLRRDLSLCCRCVHPDGAMAWVHVRAVPMDARIDAASGAAGGAHAGFIGTIEDITERRDRQERVGIQARILEEISEGVAVVSDGGTILFVNGAMETMFGYAPGSMVGLNLGELNSDSLARKRELLVKMRDTAERDGRWVGELNSVRKDGSRFISRASISSFEQDGEKRWISVRRDISESRRLESAVLLLAQGEQRDVAHALHEGLGQELTGLSLVVRAFRKSRGAADAALCDFLSELERHLSDAVASARRAAEGLTAFNLEREDFSLALARAVANFEARFSIPCSLGIADEAQLLSPFQRHQLYFIIREALENAGVHSGASRLAVTIERDARGVVAHVRDDGQGIKVRTRGGEGMGLAIMRHRAGLIAATLEITAIAPHGTCVTIVLGGAGATATGLVGHAIACSDDGEAAATPRAAPPTRP